MVIYHHLQGYLTSMENLCEHKVGIYINNYKSDGINGLVMNKSNGAPRLLNKEQEELFVETIINNTPNKVGFAPRFTSA
jgi:putative transposase